jgi:signal transduction histidine kinase
MIAIRNRPGSVDWGRVEKRADLITTRGFRLGLIAGFGGVLLIFVAGAVESVRLLRQMRAENQVLREASLERSRRLASARSYILLTEAYVREPPFDVDARKPSDVRTKMREGCLRALNDLDGYRTSNQEESLSLKNLQAALKQHWRQVEQAVASDRPRRTSAGADIVSLRTAVLEINTHVDDVEARQVAATQSAIQEQFENLGRRLSRVLIIALCAALLLAAGSMAYILRIERQNRRRYQEIVKARQALEQLSARLVDAQETERRAISRELHDEVGQTLGAVLVDAANLAARIPDEDTTSRRYLDNIRAQADASINSIRNIALLLRPSMLDDLGLIPALEWQAREVSRRSSLKVKVVAENVQDSLPDALRTCVYRIVQEALHNASRHSGARSGVVRVRQTENALELSVQDDGSGFDPETTRGLGLLGIEERVKQLGGRIEIQSQPGKGTGLRVLLPT